MNYSKFVKCIWYDFMLKVRLNINKVKVKKNEMRKSDFFFSIKIKKNLKKLFLLGWNCTILKNNSKSGLNLKVCC